MSCVYSLFLFFILFFVCRHLGTDFAALKGASSTDQSGTFKTNFFPLSLFHSLFLLVRVSLFESLQIKTTGV